MIAVLFSGVEGGSIGSIYQTQFNDASKCKSSGFSEPMILLFKLSILKTENELIDDKFSLTIFKLTYL